jgi:hypothetical protein
LRDRVESTLDLQEPNDAAEGIEPELPDIDPAFTAIEINRDWTELADSDSNAVTAAGNSSTENAADSSSSEPPVPNAAPIVQSRLSSPGIKALADSAQPFMLGTADEPTNRANVSGAGGSSAKFFGLAAAGTHSVAYVIDCSGSMGKPPLKLQMAKDELTRSIRALDSEQAFYVVFFSHNMFLMPGEGLLIASDENKERVCQWIDGALSGGGTNPYPAVVHALQLKPETIYLLSDGIFKTEYVRAIRSRNRGQRRTTIYTIGFGDRSGEKQMVRLARENGGSYRYVEPHFP